MDWQVTIEDFLSPQQLKKLDDRAAELAREIDEINMREAKKLLDETFPGNSFTLQLVSRREEMLNIPTFYHSYFQVLADGIDTRVMVHAATSDLDFMRMENANFVHPFTKTKMTTRTVSKRLAA